ncbi:MAG: hypothetical protein KIT79_10040 [Deltaproteobacteria bacterium]|nr:hypothetical protein [Deltaproteobacteria bacterium]
MKSAARTAMLMLFWVLQPGCVQEKPPVIGSLTATPDKVSPGEATTITWNVEHAHSCVLNGTEVGPESDSIVVQIYPPVTYLLACSNVAGSTQAEVTVERRPDPPAPEPVTFNYAYASPNPVPEGGTVTLYWSAMNADYCTLDNHEVEYEPVWSYPISPVFLRSTHLVTCRNDSYSASQSITINVTPAPPPPVGIGTFTASPATITAGSTATLAWSGVTNATACSIDNGVGSVTIPSGSKTVTPTAPTIYALNCNGAGSPATRSVTVTVTPAPPPPVPQVEIVLFAANPVSVISGQPVTLTWTVNNATNCTITGIGSVTPIGGNTVVTPLVSTTYRLDCSNAVDSAAPAFINITVTVPSTPPAAPDCNSFPNPPAGTSVVSSWCAKRDGFTKFYCETVDDPVNFVPRYNVCSKSLDTTIGAVKLTVVTGTDVGVAVAEAKPALQRGTPVMICASVWVPSSSGVLPRVGIDWFQTTGSPGANYLDAFGPHWSWPTNTWVNVCMGPSSEVFSGRRDRWPGDGPSMFVPPSPYGQFAGGWMQFLGGLTQGMGSAGEAWVANLTVYGVR